MHLPLYMYTSCPCWLQVVHVQVWNELREGWEVFWYETWRTVGYRISGCLFQVKRKDFKNRAGLMKG